MKKGLITSIKPMLLKWWSKPGLNRRHMDFQSIALPTELPDHLDTRYILDGGPDENRTRDLLRDREAC